ncbi:hypothetical protein Ccrd_014227 [Cynara cardunculus var. scolymus]|uniref:NTF2-like domain-containing protein n=1 Tax=Cynara cardunculus var. scolymus TaxID=59895 RepID=A0A103YE58_CYNCS|nr:hypothetical protein Ccrd_014227 [Cynara cardunculus var. scolymus]
MSPWRHHVPPFRSSHYSSMLLSLLLRSTSTLSHHRHPFFLNLPRSAMEANSKDTEEPKKVQQGETCYKGASDVDPSKKVSDLILPHILNLYASRALPRDFEIYAPDASFEDPLMCARGINQIKSAFYSLSKDMLLNLLPICFSRTSSVTELYDVFSESRIVEYSIKENILPHGRREIVIDNKQYYKFMGKDIDMISLIKLYVENGKVVRHEDWWNKKPLWDRETSKVPLFGQIMEMTRRASMLATHAMMRFGKDPTK